ncbi:HIT family protein [Cyanobium gracile]|uniref:HIT family protein n=1 Tax=Cyanobium gracile TaxID=59930 RepID=UPI003A4C57EC
MLCALEGSGRVLLENELALCIADAYPVSGGHSLVIPRRHDADGMTLHQPEWNAVVELLRKRRERLSSQDEAISGWNVGLNSGEAAGQSVFHAHWHLIPRREGDCEQSRGGVRGGGFVNDRDLENELERASSSELRTTDWIHHRDYMTLTASMPTLHLEGLQTQQLSYHSPKSAVRPVSHKAQGQE